MYFKSEKCFVCNFEYLYYCYIDMTENERKHTNAVWQSHCDRFNLGA